MVVIQLILFYNKFQTTCISGLWKTIIEKQKSMGWKAYHIDLLKILPFLSMLYIFDAFQCSDDSHKNVQSKNIATADAKQIL